VKNLSCKLKYKNIDYLLLKTFTYRTVKKPVEKKRNEVGQTLTDYGAAHRRSQAKCRLVQSINEIWTIGLSSAFEKARLNSGVRLFLELYCVTVIKHVTFFIYLSDLINNIGGLTDLAKKGTDRRYSYSPSSLNESS